MEEDFEFAVDNGIYNRRITELERSVECAVDRLSGLSLPGLSRYTKDELAEFIMSSQRIAPTQQDSTPALPTVDTSGLTKNANQLSEAKPATGHDQGELYKYLCEMEARLKQGTDEVKIFTNAVAKVVIRRTISLATKPLGCMYLFGLNRVSSLNLI